MQIFDAYRDQIDELYFTIERDMDELWRIAMKKMNESGWRLCEKQYETAEKAQAALNDMAADASLLQFMEALTPITTERLERNLIHPEPGVLNVDHLFREE